MEFKKLNMSFNKSLKGGLSGRVIFPASWLKDLDITENDRELCVYKTVDKIYISKKPIRFYKPTIIDEVFREFQVLLKTKKWTSTQWLRDILNGYARAMAVGNSLDIVIEEDLLMVYNDLLNRFNKYEDKKSIEEKKGLKEVEYIEQSLFEDNGVEEQEYSLPFDEEPTIYYYNSKLDFKTLEDFKIFVGLSKPQVVRVAVKDKTSKQILNMFEDMDEDEREKILSSMKRIKKKREKKATEPTEPAEDK